MSYTNDKRWSCNSQQAGYRIFIVFSGVVILMAPVSSLAQTGLECCQAYTVSCPKPDYVTDLPSSACGVGVV